MRTAKVQASLRICAVSPEPSLLAHTSSESRGTFRQKARSLAPLNGWACAVIICHDGMLEDTNSLDGARMQVSKHTYSTVKQRIRIGHGTGHMFIQNDKISTGCETNCTISKYANLIEDMHSLRHTQCSCSKNLETKSDVLKMQ